MDYFSRAWALGDLSDQASKRIEEDYRSYIASLDRAASVSRFATTISLNDAYVDRFRITSGNVSLRLLTGDMQRGYWLTELTYGGGTVLAGLEVLERAVADRPTEIWYDEFSGRSPEMVHRFLLVRPNSTEDRGEFHVGFSDFSFAEVRAQGRELPPL